MALARHPFSRCAHVASSFANDRANRGVKVVPRVLKGLKQSFAEYSNHQFASFHQEIHR